MGGDPSPRPAQRLVGDPRNPEWGQARPSPGPGTETPSQGSPRAPEHRDQAGAGAPGRAVPGRGLGFGSCVFKRWLAPGCSCCFCAIETVEIHYS